MSHFYGSMQGNRGEATRMGTKSSGIEAHVRTWSRGVYTSFQHNSEFETDDLTISITGGSNGGVRQVFVHIPAIKLTAILEGRAVLAVVPFESGAGKTK